MTFRFRIPNRPNLSNGYSVIELVTILTIVGVITAMVGGPFFLFLFLRHLRER